MFSLSSHFTSSTIRLMLVLACIHGQGVSTSPDVLQKLNEDIEYFTKMPCTPYVAVQCNSASTMFDADACATASRSFYSENRAGLYAISSNGGWKQVTNYNGTLVNGPNTLHDLGTDYFDSSFTKLIVYSHGRVMELHKVAAHNRFMDDGFCRRLDGETVAYDYAKMFREQGFNVLVWYWAQYSWSPAKDGALWESGSWWWSKEYNIGTEVSPKIWADSYIRENGKGMQPEDYSKWATPAGNPLWAKFSNASLCLGKEGWACKMEHDDVFEWAKTKTDKDDFDTTLAIGNVFAESLMSIAPSLSNVETFHLVGNSYGSQIVLHGTYLVLNKTGQVQQNCSTRTQAPSIASVPVPTRLVLIDPAYKQGSVRCGLKRWCFRDPILDLAMNQLKVIHDYGVPTLKVDATALANQMLGTLDTSALSYNAATFHIKMFEGFSTKPHTQSVDWYFRTYFPSFPDSEIASSNSCSNTSGTEAIVFGCTADSVATASFDRIVSDEKGVGVRRQVSVNANPWNATWQNQWKCFNHGFWKLGGWLFGIFETGSNLHCDESQLGKPCWSQAPNVASHSEASRAGLHR